MKRYTGSFQFSTSEQKFRKGDGEPSVEEINSSDWREDVEKFQAGRFDGEGDGESSGSQE